MWKALLLALCLIFSSVRPVTAAPASDARVGGGMLMAIGLPLAVIGIAGWVSPSSGPFGSNMQAWSVGMALGGTAATALGWRLWVKAGPSPQAALSWAY